MKVKSSDICPRIDKFPSLQYNRDQFHANKEIHKHEKNKPIPNLCVNTMGVLDHKYPELSVARATLVFI